MHRIVKAGLLALVPGLALCVAAPLRANEGGALTVPVGKASSGDQTFEQRFPHLAQDATERRRRTIALMKAENVPVNEWLPVIEAEAETNLPSTEEVAMRALATLLVAARGVGLERERVEGYIRDYALGPWLSPEEKRFLADPNPGDAQLATYSWRFEAAHVLFWSLGFVDQLGSPREQTDPAAMIELIRTGTRDSFLAQAKLRSVSEVLDEADKIYRYRWALVDARINDKAAPAGLSDDVAVEWHQALNWLIRHADEPWDEVSLDT